MNIDGDGGVLVPEQMKHDIMFGWWEDKPWHVRIWRWLRRKPTRQWHPGIDSLFKDVIDRRSNAPRNWQD